MSPERKPDDDGPEVRTKVDGHVLTLRRLDKVLYPETGTTKGEVLDYYARVAPHILPQMAGRPVTRKRWPHGVAARTSSRRTPPAAPRRGCGRCGWRRPGRAAATRTSTSR